MGRAGFRLQWRVLRWAGCCQLLRLWPMHWPVCLPAAVLLSPALLLPTLLATAGSSSTRPACTQRTSGGRRRSSPTGPSTRRPRCMLCCAGPCRAVLCAAVLWWVVGATAICRWWAHAPSRCRLAELTPAFFLFSLLSNNPSTVFQPCPPPPPSLPRPRLPTQSSTVPPTRCCMGRASPRRRLWTAWWRSSTSGEGGAGQSVGEAGRVQRGFGTAGGCCLLTDSQPPWCAVCPASPVFVAAAAAMPAGATSRSAGGGRTGRTRWAVGA